LSPDLPWRDPRVPGRPARRIVDGHARSGEAASGRRSWKELASASPHPGAARRLAADRADGLVETGARKALTRVVTAAGPGGGARGARFAFPLVALRGKRAAEGSPWPSSSPRTCTMMAGRRNDPLRRRSSGAKRGTRPWKGRAPPATTAFHPASSFGPPAANAGAPESAPPRLRGTGVRSAGRAGRFGLVAGRPLGGHHEERKRNRDARTRTRDDRPDRTANRGRALGAQENWLSLGAAPASPTFTDEVDR